MNQLIKEIEESKIKTEEATIKTQTMNIEITKKVAEVSQKEETAKIVMERAKIIKEDVETSVRENLDEKKIKGMQGIMNNPPLKIKLIVQAVNCLNPTGSSFGNNWEGCKNLVMKSALFYQGVRDFMEPEGSGQKLKKKHIDDSEVYLKNLWKECQPAFGLTDISQLAECVKTKISLES